MKIPPQNTGKGFVLAAVLVVVMLVSMISVSLMFQMRADRMSSQVMADTEQAWAAAMSGLYKAMETAGNRTPGSLTWQDNPDLFKDQLVLDDGADRWYYSVYSMSAAQAEAGSEAFHYGLSDEASKVNVLEVKEEDLGKLPEMWPPRAQAIMDFLDADAQSRTEGAESDYYAELPHPYITRDGPLISLEELLLVKGITLELYFGEDANMNFRLDPNEDDGLENFPPDNNNGNLDLGLRQYLTIYSYDNNLDNEGLPRLALNDPELTFDLLDLSESTLNYIHTLQSNKVIFGHPADLLEARHTITSSGGQGRELTSGIGKEELPLILDQLTCTNETQLPGRINVNTAPAWVLQTVPGIDLFQAETMVASRASLTDEERATIAWIYQRNVVDAEQFRQAAPWLTARSFQFRFHVVGFGLPSGRYRILEAVIDMAAPQPTVLYLRDLTRLGLPFPVSQELLPQTSQNDNG